MSVSSTALSTPLQGRSEWGPDSLISHQQPTSGQFRWYCNFGGSKQPGLQIRRGHERIIRKCAVIIGLQVSKIVITFYYPLCKNSTTVSILKLSFRCLVSVSFQSSFPRRRLAKLVTRWDYWVNYNKMSCNDVTGYIKVICLSYMMTVLNSEHTSSCEIHLFT